MSRAVVFGYHDVGVRCLSVLLARGVDVRLVVTHEDDPNENVWFGSVAETARRNDIPVVTPVSPKDADLAGRIAAAQPDFIFSFYYRRMIPGTVLRIAGRSALNMHGSLLPRYRGRSPVNWAILNGETRTGVTLHHMTARADAGDIVGQEPVSILPDDRALDVFRKITDAAERLLDRTLPGLLDGTARAVPQDEAGATTFGGRTPEDGRIDWGRPAAAIHDLVRAVAPPWPGAFTTLEGETVFIYRTARVQTAPEVPTNGRLYGAHGRCYVVCGDGAALRILEAARGGAPVDLEALARQIEGRPVALPA